MLTAACPALLREDLVRVSGTMRLGQELGLLGVS